MDLPERGAVSRRDYLRATVAIGGTVGLSACLGSSDAGAVPRGDPTSRPERQHAWNDALETEADGTTMAVLTLDLQLEAWFEQDNHFQRVTKTFNPEHTRDGVGNIGEELGSSTGAGGDIAARTESDAKQGLVGHAQKAARARDDNCPV